MRPGGPMMMMHSMGDPDAPRSAKLKAGTARRVLAYTTRYRGMLIGFVVVIVIQAVLQLLPALLFRRMIDHAIPSHDRPELNLLAALILGGAFFEAVLSLFERYWSSRIGEGLIYDLRVTLFDHVQRMPISFFTRTQTGALVSRMNNDVIGAQRAVTGTLGSVVSNSITLTTVLITLFILQWQLTLLALVLLPLFLLPAKRVGRRLQTITRESMNHNAAMNTQMTERFNVAGALLVKLFGRPKSEVDEFSGRADRVRAIGVSSAMYSRVVVVALTLVGAVGTAAIYWIGGQLAISGSLTTGTLAAMGILVARIYMPLTSLTNARIDVMSAMVSFERVFEVLDAPNTISDKPDATTLDDVKGAIEFDHVTFRYPRADETSVPSLELSSVHNYAGENVEVLRDINLSIAQGQLVALVGPSGAGKTTLASLVPRLYDVTSGAVRIDGHDVRDLTQASVHDAIGVVSQDPHLFHDTVLSNLRYARPDATFDEIQAACRAAQIHDVIAALPDGYDTLVGERGYRLSGGEKQRLAIARMLVKDPAIVVLDEATSHLDSENESLVQQALANALANRTAIVIAHRLSTITNADQIVVIDEGRVVERGRHEELRAAGGLYADLYNTLVRDHGSHDIIDNIDAPVA
ncbi:MAG: ABC transporter ATP-binding protein [Acidimicrobiales bacterium]